jgi:uncharacterized membrane protein YcgQ (UPF0703/DUF1980 family)
MNAIDLNLDEENELTFQVNVEGTRPAEAKCRLAIDNKDINLLFEAQEFKNDNVTIVLPPLKHVLKEGEYNMTLEVIVEDKYFTPLSIVGNFEKSISITAESVQNIKRKKTNATASFVNTSSRKKVLKEETDKKPVKINQTSKIKNLNKSKINPKKRKITDKEIMKIIEALSNKRGRRTK